MKSILTFFILTFLTFSIYGQSFGVRVGANVADLISDDTESAMILSWQFGGYLNFDLSDNMDMNIAVLYSKKGGKDEVNNISSDLEYLEIPIMFRFNVSALFLQAGPYGSFLLGANANGVDIKEFLSDGDYGIQFGAGINLGGLRLDGRYSYGMADIDDIDTQSLKNSVITFGIEFDF